MRMRLGPNERHQIQDAVRIIPTGRVGEFVASASSPLAKLHNVLSVQGQTLTRFIAEFAHSGDKRALLTPV